jgi:hypothetical protein
MARERRPVPPAYEPAPQEEMTVVVVKVKGGPDSMQKGFDVVNNAIASLGPAQPAHHRTPAQIPATPLQNGRVIDTEIEEPEGEVQDPVPETPATAAPAEPSKPRKSYTFMSDFNLSPSGVPSLKDYCAGKNPQSDNDKFLIAAAWIQTHGGTEQFTGRHLFTAFRAMQWKTQTDMTKPMRRLKSKKSYFENPSSGNWKLTGIGLEAAEEIGK